MKVFVTGDIHGAKDIHKLNSKNFIEASFLTKDDFLIITGDFFITSDSNESTVK